MALACFGAELKIGVPSGAGLHPYATYAVGYYVEEKTGIAPLFVEVEKGEAALHSGKIDLWLDIGERDAPEGVEIRPGAEVVVLGKVAFWLNPEVLDDLRFTTVERALEHAAVFLTSEHFEENASDENPKKAARKAVTESD